MAETLRRVVGTEAGLRFELHLGLPAQADRALAWGEGRLFVAGELLWAQENEAGDIGPVAWTWVDLLDFLGRSWAWLMMEESYPIAITPPTPLEMEREARRRWEELPPDEVEEEEIVLYQFRQRHDLALGMEGIYLPSLLLLRQGRECLVSVPAWERTHVLRFDEVRQTLLEIGDLLSDWIGPTDHPRAAEARRLWSERAASVSENRLAIRTGLSPTRLKAIEGGEGPAGFWESDPERPEEDTELLAVARMSAPVTSAAVQRQLIAAVKETAPIATPDLDRLAEAARGCCGPALPPFEQGYGIAQWLRETLPVENGVRVDPEALLAAWGVPVWELMLGEEGGHIDALAAWGPSHGPAILLNTSPEARPAHPHGRRTTLAHEICHLLVDRDGALPMAEVLGGAAPRQPEQRARAFAAELLLPRMTAAVIARMSATLEEAVEQLTRQFEVSRELVAWQIRNSPARSSLSQEDRAFLDRLTGRSRPDYTF